MEKTRKSKQFAKMPFEILKDKKYKGILNNNDRVVYTLMRDRVSLSKENAEYGWTNENGQLFIRYTIPELAEDADIGVSTVKRSIKKLKEVGLISLSSEQIANKPNDYIVFDLLHGIEESRNLAFNTKTKVSKMDLRNKENDIHEVKMDGHEVKMDHESDLSIQTIKNNIINNYSASLIYKMSEKYEKTFSKLNSEHGHFIIERIERNIAQRGLEGEAMKRYINACLKNENNDKEIQEVITLRKKKEKKQTKRDILNDTTPWGRAIEEHEKKVAEQSNPIESQLKFAIMQGERGNEQAILSVVEFINSKDNNERRKLVEKVKNMAKKGIIFINREDMLIVKDRKEWKLENKTLSLANTGTMSIW